MPDFINGYELFQLTCSGGAAPTEGIKFTEISHDFGDAAYQSELYGSQLGEKNWNINLELLRDSTASKTVSFQGTNYTPVQYIYDLYCRQKISGKPFVIESPVNGQYYLARFAVGQDMSFERIAIKLFSSGLQLIEQRIPGITVFDPTKISGVISVYQAEELDDSFSDAEDVTGEFLTDQTGSKDGMYLAVNAVLQTNELNGKSCVRFDGGGGGGGYGLIDQPLTFTHLFIACRINEATFSGHTGIVSSLTSAIILGNDTDTNLFNIGYTDALYKYSLNSTYYLEANQPAPMEVGGIIQAKWLTGYPVNEIQVAKDQEYGTRFAPMDFFEMITANGLPDFEVRETVNYLYTKYGIGSQ